MPDQHHILITCGTSQIDKTKINMLGLGIENNTIDEFYDQIEYSQLNPEDFFTRYRSIANEMVEKLVERRDQLGMPITRDSPFGAEITTLESLKSLNGWGGWNRKNDTYVILSSDTGPGYFCAKVLRALLIHQEFWAIPRGNVNAAPVKIPRLKDCPPSEMVASEALKNLTDKIHENLIHSRGCHPQIKRNVFLMTGGYKSIIPCLTMFSLFYGIELVYLFEHASYAQSLFPNIQFNPGEWTQWNNSCRRLAEMNQENEYLKLILEKRPDSPDERF